MLKPEEKSQNNIEMQYKEINENMIMKNHFHNSHEIIYIVEGKAEFTINAKIYTVTKGDLIFISNFESHNLKVVDHPYKRYFILVNPDHFQSLINNPILTSILKLRPEHFQHIVPMDKENSLYIKEFMVEMYNEYTEEDMFWESSLDSKLNLLFIYLYRHFKEYFPLSVLNRSTNIIIEIQKYIEQNYWDNVDLKEVSKIFYTDMYSISRLFKKVTGFKFKEYLILQRISKAKELLFYSPQDITNVGMNSGFNNVNHFIRIFKKYEGVTPYQYRLIHTKQK